MTDHASLAAFVSTYGYGAVFGAIALESAGLPLPGETILLAAAAYAAASGDLSLAPIIAAAASGAALGDMAGYAIGRRFGAALFERHGAIVGLTRERLKLARYLFSRFGGWMVFFARFVTLLRVLGGPLAGAHLYDFRKFVAFNASGAVVWSTLIGALGYFLPAAFERLQGPFGIAAMIAVIAALIALRRFYKANERRLQAEAEAAFPDRVSRD